MGLLEAPGGRARAALPLRGERPFRGLGEPKPYAHCSLETRRRPNLTPSIVWRPRGAQTFIFLYFFKVLVAPGPKNLHFPLVCQGFGGLGTQKPSFSFTFSRFWWPGDPKTFSSSICAPMHCGVWDHTCASRVDRSSYILFFLSPPDIAAKALFERPASLRSAL